MTSYKDYFLFVSEPRNYKEVRQIQTYTSIQNASELTVHISGKVIYGILVHYENSTTKEIREIIKKEGGWLIRTKNNRPIRIVKEVNQELLGKMLELNGLESVKIFSRGSINLGFNLDRGKSVLRMISNYFSHTYGENKN